MSAHLSVFQISADAEELYRRMLRSVPSRLAPYATELGWSLSLATEALESLIAAGLVRETADGLVLVEHPRSALERLVGNEEAKLDVRHRELADVRASIGNFTAEHRTAGSTGGWAVTQPVWEVVTPQLAASMVEHTLRSTSGPVRTSMRSLEVGFGMDDEATRAGQSALTGGRDRRAIYPLMGLKDPVCRRWAQSWAGIGEQQRVSESPPSEFAIFGGEVVLAVAQWRSVESDYVFIRDPMVIAAFTAMFDYAWELALPMPGIRSDIAEEQQLLRLLASGFKDESIARYLDWSLRTVRRRVATMMDNVAADTRFQLGAAAQRRGLLEDGRRPVSR
jgi:DNA-binding CsgD family transcriptional regulator